MSLLFWAFACGNNFHPIHTSYEAPVAYRSGQMSIEDFEDTLQGYAIDMVIDLDGDPRYATLEAACCERYGIAYHTIYLSGVQLPTTSQLTTLTSLLTAAKQSHKRVLLHCQRGADRTALASAVAKLILHDASVEHAQEAFSLRYGHVCTGDCIFERILKAYQPWEGQLSFAEWVSDHYKPSDMVPSSTSAISPP